MTRILQRRFARSAGVAVLLTATLFLTDLPAEERDTKSAPHYYEDARRRVSEGDIDGALIQIKNALRADPEHLPSRELAGQIMLRKGDGAGAEHAFREAREMGADRSAIAVSLAKALFIQGKYKQLIEQIPIGDVAESTRAEMLVLRGRAFLARGIPEDAIQEFAAAEALAPKSADPLIGQANVARYQDRDDDALALLDRAETIDAAHPDIWFFRAEIARRRSTPELALEHYGKAIKLVPEHMQSRVGRAATLIDLDRDEEARKDLEFVRAALPGDAQASYLYALVLMRAGDAEQARIVMGETDIALASLRSDFLKEHAPSLLLFGAVAYAQREYEQAYTHLARFDQMQPNHPGARKLLAAILLRRNEPIAAQNQIEPVVRVAPNDPEIHSILGEAYMMRGLYAQAQDQFRIATELAPEHSGIRAQLAVSRMFMGNKKEAEKDLLAARERDPKDVRLGLMLGRLYLSRGAFDDAIRLSRELYEVDRRNPGPFNLAGIAQLRKRNFPAARVAFTRALALDKNYIPAMLNIARVDEAELKYDAAEQQFRAILKKHPTNERVLASFARFLEARERIPEAIAAYEQLRRIVPSAVRDQLRLVELYLRAGNTKAAEEVTTELESRHTNNVLLLIARARTQLAARAESAAAVTLRRASRFAGTNARVLHKIGMLQMDAGDLGGARFSLEQSIASDSTYIAASAELVRVDLKAGQGELALERVQLLRKAHPESAGIDGLFGDVLMSLKRYAEAAAAYEKAAAKNTKYPGIAQLVYQARRAGGDTVGGVRWVREWIAAKGIDPALQKLLADGYYELGDLERALKEFESLLAQSPQDGAVLNSISRIYQQRGDKRAVEFAERALKTSPESAQFLDSFGWALATTGNHEQGLEFLRQAHTRAADDPQILYHLAAVLFELGREREAVEELQTSLKSTKEFPDRLEAEALLKRLRSN